MSKLKWHKIDAESIQKHITKIRSERWIEVRKVNYHPTFRNVSNKKYECIEWEMYKNWELYRYE